MVVHGIENRPDRHGTCRILSNRTDSRNLATLVFSDISGRFWTDRHYLFVVFITST
jgi:hypothetical protein